MKIHEYQAKQLLRNFGIDIPAGRVTLNADHARRIASRLKNPIMIKAQVHAGGRGKGGGIKRAASPKDAERITLELLGTRLITAQTPKEGLFIQRVLVEEKIEAAKEFYLAITIDSTKACPVILARREGGVDVEESWSDTFLQEVDIGFGPREFQIEKLGLDLGIDEALIPAFISLASNLYRLFVEKDCLLSEINPLILTKDGRFVAADAKIVFDDNALFRHPEIGILRDSTQKAPLEAEAERCGVNYVQCDGDIAVVGNGAGLTMATRDAIEFAGGKAGSFLDLSGGIDADKEGVENAFRIIFSDPFAKGILFNVVAGVFRSEALVSGLTKIIEETGSQIPLVMRIEGRGAQENKKALREAEIDFVGVNNMKKGVIQAMKLRKNKVRT